MSISRLFLAASQIVGFSAPNALTQFANESSDRYVSKLVLEIKVPSNAVSETALRGLAAKLRTGGAQSRDNVNLKGGRVIGLDLLNEMTVRQWRATAITCSGEVVPKTACQHCARMANPEPTSAHLGAFLVSAGSLARPPTRRNRFKFERGPGSLRRMIEGKGIWTEEVKF